MGLVAQGSHGSEGLRRRRAGLWPDPSVRRKQATPKQAGTWGPSPRGSQARIQMPFAQQVPGKTSFWEGSEKGRLGGGLWPGQEQGPGLLNKHHSARRKWEPGPGHPPPSPSGLPQPPTPGRRGERRGDGETARAGACKVFFC